MDQADGPRGWFQGEPDGGAIEPVCPEHVFHRVPRNGRAPQQGWWMPTRLIRTCQASPGAQNSRPTSSTDAPAPMRIADCPEGVDDLQDRNGPVLSCTCLVTLQASAGRWFNPCLIANNYLLTLDIGTFCFQSSLVTASAGLSRAQSGGLGRVQASAGRARALFPGCSRLAKRPWRRLRRVVCGIHAIPGDSVLRATGING